MKRIIFFLVICFLLQPLARAKGVRTYSGNAKIYLEEHFQRRLRQQERQQHNNDAATAELTVSLRLWAEQGNNQELLNVARRVQRAGKMAVDCESSQVAYLWLHNGEENFVCLLPGVLLEKDYLGNNLLHKAKNLQTVTAVGYVVRNFYPSDFSVIQRLQDEKNLAQETPLISHVSRGDLESFFQLYEGSSLSKAIEAQEKAGFSNQDLSSQSATFAYWSEIEKYGMNAAGKNIVQLVQQQQPCEAQKNILHFFSRHAPYLLNERNLL